MSDLDHRVTKLEYRVDGHDKEIASVTTDTRELTKTQFAILTNLTQIKWAVIGAGLVGAFSFLDVKEFIKLAISIVL